MSGALADKSQLRRVTISPLRYPGGKGSLYSRLKSFVRANDLTQGTYVEPYAGGAGAALALLVTGQVQRIVINDLDPAVYAFWSAVVAEPARFTERITKAELTVKEWSRQKELYLDPSADPFELGFATFYLNRTNRSGVLNGGPIGGMDQTGNYKIDARFNKETLTERIRVIGLHARRISVTNTDGIKVIKKHARRPSTFIYADPPYFDKAGSLYLNSFGDDDHAKLAECLNGYADTKWVLTYDNVSQVKDLYSDRRSSLFSLNYSAHRVVKTKEIMVFSDGLVVPPELDEAQG
ncbi:DNA adenine methylase [Kibdelosporangium philippinense]|uniref:site-specific DNA-methyltransferase (adenine-specific) n=1 Tax=Kibdelosporangium philippinense TaxID=211113 RepID=A0ABS8ZSX1_9PSEU|nr:DNA adenine methylase [Kibdelosporangium philippinense]MCE7009543.1 DNA adenine methylase [Kibdelosporangium philippinense]